MRGGSIKTPKALGQVDAVLSEVGVDGFYFLAAESPVGKRHLQICERYLDARGGGRFGDSHRGSSDIIGQFVAIHQ